MKLDNCGSCGAITECVAHPLEVDYMAVCVPCLDKELADCCEED